MNQTANFVAGTADAVLFVNEHPDLEVKTASPAFVQRIVGDTRFDDPDFALGFATEFNDALRRLDPTAPDLRDKLVLLIEKYVRERWLYTNPNIIYVGTLDLNRERRDATDQES